MNVYGIHWPNIDISDDEARRIASLGVSNITLLHLQAGQLPLIRELFEGTILCRFYDKGFLSQNTVVYAERVAYEAMRWMLYTHDWVFSNEMNLEMESGPGYDDIQRVTDWIVAVAKRLRALCPWMRLHAPAYSPSGNWTEYIRRLAPHINAGLFHVADVHAYGSFDMMASVVKAHRVYYGADVPLFVSELNGPGTLDFFKWLETQPNVLGGTYYIWRWANPDMPGWDKDLMGSPLEQQIRDATKLEIGEDTDMANWAFTLGFASYAQEHPEVGTPTSDLMYDANGNGLQYTTSGKMEWNKASNGIYFFRRAIP